MSLLVIRGGSKAFVPPASASVHVRIDAIQVLAVAACVNPLARLLYYSCGHAPFFHRLSTVAISGPECVACASFPQNWRVANC